MYPAKVLHAARAARSSGGPAPSGSWSRNHRHIRSPEWMKKIEQNSARNAAVSASTTRPALLSALLISVVRCRDTNELILSWAPDSTPCRTRNGGPSSHRSIRPIPPRSSPTSRPASAAAALPTSVSSPSTAKSVPNTATATASGLGSARASRSASGRSRAVATSARNTATATSSNRPSTVNAR
ncbi:hypothetical protein JOF35_008052 [Streptomyces demainii]|uniref:Uncharacterized protein n=1 Tax=Streptomyces demainii TaxID=588122 RepID=A0ABT9L4S5_9ACTN|nr:hypothetical protein [Streptomyces demainii]